MSDQPREPIDGYPEQIAADAPPTDRCFCKTAAGIGVEELLRRDGQIPPLKLRPGCDMRNIATDDELEVPYVNGYPDSERYII